MDELQTMGAPKPVKLDFSLNEGGQIKPVHVDLSRGGDLYPLFLAFGLIEVKSLQMAMTADHACCVLKNIPVYTACRFYGTQPALMSQLIMNTTCLIAPMHMRCPPGLGFS